MRQILTYRYMNTNYSCTLSILQTTGRCIILCSDLKSLKDFCMFNLITLSLAVLLLISFYLYKKSKKKKSPFNDYLIDSFL